MNRKTSSGLKIISNNRKAKFNYFFIEFYEAGIVLKGSEVKSLRNGKANISESYAFGDKGELFMINSHVAHDCILGDNVIMSNLSTLGGHVEVGEWAILGGGVLVHKL